MDLVLVGETLELERGSDYGGVFNDRSIVIVGDRFVGNQLATNTWLIVIETGPS